MDMSVFDLFKIGIGPSSSHTVGPMVAARRFLLDHGPLEDVTGVTAELYGSLALTGVGHGTDTAVILGLMGETPQGVDPGRVDEMLAEAQLSGELNLLGVKTVPFVRARHLVFHKTENLPEHPNGMRFTLHRAGGDTSKVYYSVGGGFIRAEGEGAAPGNKSGEKPAGEPAVPYPFDTMADLLAHGARTALTIPQMLRANELAHMPAEQLDAGLDRIWQVMRSCIARGLETSGQLPGGLNVKRRAAKLWQQAQGADRANELPHDALNGVSLYAMAVNEENAAGGRVVTAPTNGAAGIMPAVLKYYAEDCKPLDPVRGVREFLLSAAAIGMLCKRNASISGAEIGCQGEVGVACAMAAAGLVAALGGSNAQIENAAEIGIEHHLGMTCDPIGGLVQIPCIERNGMGAVKAITAASLALKGDGTHFVSLDEVIETMRQTGADMGAKYKETSLGGLAVHVVTVNHAAC
ncbi:L-serine ammonia-lyase [Pseudoduganella sp. SL102]|uniref:L-serine ammonia-lyase n=1 Tax=Pseudoduganella sp. SL102 TaxID=2995154 RepID=UPI00248D0399|nr:L-serine ammonia-lyase [Pseudoduganella sp. SL102]WBS00298.1 L-serine ammonia-lyase [Pseudoduganella sp. SL102]